jgi:hypothetical protein
MGVVLTNAPRRRQADYGGERAPRAGGLVPS